MDNCVKLLLSGSLLSLWDVFFSICWDVWRCQRTLEVFGSSVPQWCSFEFLWVSAWLAEEVFFPAVGVFFPLFPSPFTFLEGVTGLGLVGIILPQYGFLMFFVSLGRHFNQTCLEEACLPASSSTGALDFGSRNAELCWNDHDGRVSECNILVISMILHGWYGWFPIRNQFVTQVLAWYFATSFQSRACVFICVFVCV